MIKLDEQKRDVLKAVQDELIAMAKEIDHILDRNEMQPSEVMHLFAPVVPLTILAVDAAIVDEDAINQEELHTTMQDAVMRVASRLTVYKPSDFYFDTEHYY